ncbi:hypothetical protein TIFTF001_011537 [Ficus carica]|uniref:Uncharacterized protein n=1 Tax=Ficus carica TaxID=3494 RepID=A0AA87ZU88_FICCA|nr:hypothetical protein TIFTF001_011537 [Ficus carica]
MEEKEGKEEEEVPHTKRITKIFTKRFFVELRGKRRDKDSETEEKKKRESWEGRKEGQESFWVVTKKERKGKGKSKRKEKGERKQMGATSD